MLSAVEGLEVATPVFSGYVIPMTVIILVVLFAVQRFGTGKVGAAFGPVTMVWFGLLAVLGALAEKGRHRLSIEGRRHDRQPQV